MSITIMKFGGTSVANLGRIKKAAQIVKSKIISNKKKVLVVVSAMSGVTNNLVKTFNKISLKTDNPEYDVIVSTGEQYSSGAMSAVLNEAGIKSRSLLGWQIPILTDNNYGKARIMSVESQRIKKLFNSFMFSLLQDFKDYLKIIGSQLWVEEVRIHLQSPWLLQLNQIFVKFLLMLKEFILQIRELLKMLKKLKILLTKKFWKCHLQDLKYFIQDRLN